MSSTFKLSARVSTDSPPRIAPVLEKLFPKRAVTERGGEFVIETSIETSNETSNEGENAKDLNRELLSALRKVERKTRLRAEWTSTEGVTYRFFDYVLKKIVREER